MKTKRWIVLSCAALSLAASGPPQIDASQVSCAQFRELPPSRQKRILSFLQGYAHRDVPEDKVGSVPVGAGLGRVVDGCIHSPYAPVATKVQELASGGGKPARGDASLTRAPTLLTCREFQKLGREDQRLTVYWLDGYSRKSDPADANQSIVALDRDPEDLAKKACSKRQQRLWWAIQGAARSVAPAQAD